MASQIIHSFLFRVDELSANDTPGVPGAVQARVLGNKWIPPNVVNGFHKPVTGDPYRWQNGTVTAAPECDTWQCTYHSAATVFYCNDFLKFYTAIGHANLRNMDECDWEYGWHDLQFRHEANGLSCADHAGLDYVAVKQAAWIKELVPKEYRSKHAPSSRVGGLGGRLSILAALVAFSCQDRLALETVLTQDKAWKNWKWQPHKKPTGRVEQRGVVVSIFLDPYNEAGSTKEILDWYEDGGHAIFL